MDVLLVDDVYENRYLLSILLKNKGYTVVEANNGKEAFDQAYLKVPDIVISDILMPVKDGFTLCREWRADPLLKDIPFIFYTATYTEPKDEALALSLGADRFFIKPMNTATLLAEVEALLQEYKQSGKITPEPAISSEAYYRRYNESLVKKLEDKLIQIEDRNRRLFDSERALRSMNQEVSKRLVEARSAEKSSRLAMKRYEMAADVGRVGIWEWNHIDGKVFVDHNLREMLGVAGSSSLDYDGFIELFHVEDRDGLNRMLQTLAQGRQDGMSVTCRMRDVAGDLRWFVVRASLMSAAQGESVVVGANADITEQKVLERQLSQLYKMEALGQLTAGIAHDFNNILASIVGYTELLSFEISDKQGNARNYVDQVLYAGERASNLVNKLLAFGRNRESVFEITELAVSLGDAVEMLRSTLPSTIEVSLFSDTDQPKVLLDVTQFHQIIMNLCVNARDAMGGRGKLQINSGMLSINNKICSGCGRKFSGDYVCVKVSDTGPGISSEVQKRIFDPFFTTKDPDKGTGLGLSVVHGAMHDHKGHVSLKTRPEIDGTEFELFFPIAEGVTVSDEPLTGVMQRNSYSGQVFVLDDEPSICKLLEEIMSERGFKVYGFTDPGDLLRVLAADPASCDVVVTDQTMPNMLGTEVLREVRQIRADLPVVLCTGYSETLDKQTAKALGADAFFIKPFNAVDLVHTIGSLIDQVSNVAESQ